MPERDDEKVKHLLASNIAYYRKKMDMTQSELAEFIHYSDKSISKWERGDGVPDICVLVLLANLFGVTVNDLLAEKHKRSRLALPKLKHSIITLMAIGLVWLAAVIVFFVLKVTLPHMQGTWLSFIIAIPVMFTVTLVFTIIWYPWIYQFVSVSGLIWSAALALDVSVSIRNMSLIYTIAAAAEVLTVLWYLPKAVQFFTKHIKRIKKLHRKRNVSESVSVPKAQERDAD